MLVCFLVEAHKSLLDHLIAMHEQYITSLLRRSRHAFDERHREFRKRARRGIQTVLSAMEILLERRTDDPLIALYRQIDEATLRAALDDCREFERLEDHGFQDELRARYTGLRRYLPTFLDLPFYAERGAEQLMAAIELAREVNRDHPQSATGRAGRICPAWLARLALPISTEVKTLRGLIESSLPRVRIEDLLREVDRETHFTRAFRPLGGYEPRSERLYPALLAALIAHGTNLGIAAMGQSAQEITVDMLQHVTQWFLREDTIKAANAALVNFHHQLPIGRIWGEGVTSSSDGQRFGIQESSLLASYYPRCFGYYERAVNVYTHTSDQYSVFGTRVISCSPHEALYVLDGLLENNAVLRLREHYTDTHGFTEHVFGLCYLLGYSFMPRLRDLADQHLFKMDRRADYGCLNPLFDGTADTELIREQWDFLVG